MKRSVMAVFDTATQLFGQPFYVAAVPAGTRSFTDEVNRRASDNSLNAHPEDYELWLLARFDDESGEYEPDRKLVVRGKDVVTNVQ